MAWAGWYNRLLANHLVWMGLLYNAYGDEKYAAAGKEILMGFAHNYLAYPTDNTISARHTFFFGRSPNRSGASIWRTAMTFSTRMGISVRKTGIALKDSLFYPLARITQKFPESASNRQLWYNNVSAAVGFLYGDRELIEFAIDGTYGFRWQLGSPSRKRVLGRMVGVSLRRPQGNDSPRRDGPAQRLRPLPHGDRGKKHEEDVRCSVPAYTTEFRIPEKQRQRRPEASWSTRIL